MSLRRRRPKVSSWCLRWRRFLLKETGWRNPLQANLGGPKKAYAMTLG
jgi:hypothetical protein